MHIRTNTILIWSAVAAVALIGTFGCGQSKEEIAIERALNRPKPAQVRVVNLSGSDVNKEWSGVFDETVPAGATSLFRTMGAAKNTLNINRDGALLTSFEHEFESEELYTVVLFSGGSDGYTYYQDAALYPDASSNLTAKFIDHNGNGISGEVELVDGGTSYTVSSDSGAMKLDTGDYEISGVDIDNAIGGRIEGDSAYTLLVVEKADGSRHAFLLRNASPDKPAMGTPAAG